MNLTQLVLTHQSILSIGLTALFILGSPFSFPGKALAAKKRQREITEFFQPLAPHFKRAKPDESRKEASIEDLDVNTLVEITQFLDRISLAQFAETHRAARLAAQMAEAQAVKLELKKLSWTTLPGIRAEQVEQLKTHSKKTEILAPLPSFQVSSPISVGFYRAVMGVYPNLTMKPFISLSQYKAIYQIAEYHESWDLNPNQPLTVTDSWENQAMIDQLNQKTGKTFRLMTRAEEEYWHRFRYFGEEDWVAERQEQLLELLQAEPPSDGFRIVLSP